MTITPYLKKRYSSDKYGIINLRITENRKSKYLSLKISIPERYWNPNKKEVRSNYDDFETINEKIRSEINRISNRLDKGKSNELVINEKRSFLRFFENYLKRLDDLDHYGTYKKYNTTIQHLKSLLESQNKTDLLFSEIDYKWIEVFDMYLYQKQLKKNTRNNYLKCCQRIYNLSIKEKLFKTYENPFDYFKFRRETVEKKRLSSGTTQDLVNLDIPYGSLLYETRNKFLIQLYGQGLRVSDLFTLRYKNINFDGSLSRINFTQFKTKKNHTIQLSSELIEHLFYYISNEKEYNNLYHLRKYEIKFKDCTKEMTHRELLKRLFKYQKDSLRSKESMTKWKFYSRKMMDIQSEITNYQRKRLTTYSSENPNDFIVPYLNQEYYENVEFTDNTRLTRKQYNHIQSKITVYNRNLKKLGKVLGTNINITSHTPRHTFTNLLLVNSTDVYSVSKSLGHQKIQVTEDYIDDFNEEKIDFDMMDTFRRIRLGKIPISPDPYS